MLLTLHTDASSEQLPCLQDWGNVILCAQFWTLGLGQHWICTEVPLSRDPVMSNPMQALIFLAHSVSCEHMAAYGGVPLAGHSTWQQYHLKHMHFHIINKPFVFLLPV